MIPQTIFAAVGFLLFVVPGLLFELLREKRRPGYRETVFREISRVALTGTAFSGASIAILTLVGLWLPSGFVAPGGFADDPGGYAGSHFGLVVWTVTAEVVLACGLAVFASWRLSDGSQVTPMPALWAVLHDKNEEGNTPLLLMRMTDGSVCQGILGFADWSGPDERHWIGLVHPFLTIRGGSTARSGTDGYKFLTVPVADVAEMWVKYVPVSLAGQATASPPQ